MDHRRNHPRQRRRATIARPLPLFIFLAALAPRLARLGSRPFWYDELITAQRAALPLPALLRNSFAEHHTPLYFLLVAPFAHSQDPQFWLRLPSAILGAANVLLVYLIASRAAGRPAGVAAALVIGLSPTEIAYSQEARSYMLMICFLLLALHGLAGLALHEDRAASRWRAGGLGKDWLQFIAGSAAALCTLGDAAPWLLAAAITAGVMIRRAADRPAMLRNFLAANALILACSLPLYGLILHFEGRGLGKTLAFVPASTLSLIWYDIGSLYLMRICDFVSTHFMPVRTPVLLPVLIGCALAGACLAGILRLRRRPSLQAALLGAFLTLPVLFGIVSIARPLLLPRYLLWSAPPFAILAGIGIAAMLGAWPPMRRNAALAIWAGLLLINLAPFYQAETKPGWNIAAQILAAHSQPTDVVYFFDPAAGATTHYYLPAKLQPVMVTDWGGNLQHALQAHAQGRRVWAIYGLSGLNGGWKSQAYFQSTLAPLGTPSARLQAGARITIWRFDPPACLNPPGK